MPKYRFNLPTGETGEIDAADDNEAGSMIDGIMADYNPQWIGPPVPKEIPEQPQRGWNPFDPDEGDPGRGTMGAAAVGLGENAATMASGGAATIGGGLTGLVRALTPGGAPYADTPDTFNKQMDASNKFVYSPKTEAGQELGGSLGGVMNTLDEGATVVGAKLADWTTRAFGNPAGLPEDSPVRLAIAAGFKAALETAGPGVAGDAIVTGRAAAQASKSAVNAAAAKLGLKIGSRDFIKQVGTAGKNLTVGLPSENMTMIANTLEAKYTLEKNISDSKFLKVKGDPSTSPPTPGMVAGVRVESVREFSSRLQERLFREYTDLFQNAQLSPNTHGVIEGLERLYNPDPKVNPELAQATASGALKTTGASLNYIEALIKRTQTAKYGTEEGAMMATIRDEMHGFLQNQFNYDMMLGDPTTLTAWQDAIATRATLFKRWDDTGIVKNLISKEVTPLEMRSWIMGANSVIGKPKTSGVIDSLKAVLGRDSPEFKGLQQEYLYNIVEPLLQRDPDLQQFLKNYDTAWKRNSQGLLSLEIQDTGMSDLAKYSQAAVRAGIDPTFNVNLNKLLARSIFGHAIAKAALKQSMAENIIGVLRSRGSGAAGRMYKELMGYDPDKPMIPAKSLAYFTLLSGSAHDGDVFSTPDPNEGK